MFSEFWFGNSREKQAQETVNRLKNQDTLTLKQKAKFNKAQTVTRRVFLRRLGAVAGGVTLLTSTGVALPTFLNSTNDSEYLRIRHSFNALGYQDWTHYWNNYLPTKSVMSIAENLIRAEEYPGFPEAGQLLKTALTNYQSLGQINPPYQSL